jgi:hypothetical protein
VSPPIQRVDYNVAPKDGPVESESESNSVDDTQMDIGELLNHTPLIGANLVAESTNFSTLDLKSSSSLSSVSSTKSAKRKQPSSEENGSSPKNIVPESSEIAPRVSNLRPSEFFVDGSQNCKWKFSCARGVQVKSQVSLPPSFFARLGMSWLYPRHYLGLADRIASAPLECSCGGFP